MYSLIIKSKSQSEVKETITVSHHVTSGRTSSPVCPCHRNLVLTAAKLRSCPKNGRKSVSFWRMIGDRLQVCFKLKWSSTIACCIFLTSCNITSHFQTSPKDILFSVGPSPFGCPSCLEYLHLRALILLKTLALYKPFTYLLTYELGVSPLLGGTCLPKTG